METGQVINEKVYMSPRPPPKIFLKHDWNTELGSEYAQRPEGQVEQQSRSIHSNQPIPNPSRERTVQPVVRTDRTGQPVVETNTENVPDCCQTRSCHESKSFNVGDETIRDRTGNPLLKQTQKMCQMVAKHVLVMKAYASTLGTNGATRCKP